VSGAPVAARRRAAPAAAGAERRCARSILAVGIYETHVLPRVIDLMCGNAAMADVRRPVVAGLAGTVLEVGFGSGPNIGLYPAEVTRVLAVDPAVVGQKLAARRQVAHPEPPIEHIGLDGARIDLPDESVDHALSTWTLCTIPDVQAALAEVRRVLRPGGSLHFVEHGLADEASVRRWQRRVEPVQKKVAGGCHLTRDIPELVQGAGFRLESITRFQLAGPKVLSAMWSGVAIKDPGSRTDQ
jgi:SAM-dependent methyltransferase